MSLILENATLVEIEPARVRRGTLVIDPTTGRISQVLDAGAPVPTGERLDCRGAVVMPGWVCAHTHLYSALARGMPVPAEAPQNFLQILERVWWKLDRALDAETIELSVLVGALEAARSGTTTLIDHHASPAFIDGSLDVVADALDRVGLRGLVCYEVSDRGGEAEARAGVAENDRFLSSLPRRGGRVRGLVGAHAAFTIGASTADRLAEVSHRHAAGLHIHVAEDALDARKDQRPVVAWLAERGLLDERTLLAHCVHVTDEEVDLIRSAGAHVAHNPRSNANNAVGYSRPGRFGDRLLIGTDGIGADMPAEALFAFFAARDHAHAFDVLGALARNQRFAGTLLGERLGSLEPGAPADLVVVDYPTPTPMDESNLFGHLLFGGPDRVVRHVLCDGRFVLRDRRHPSLDEAQILERARRAADRLWRTMKEG